MSTAITREGYLEAIPNERRAAFVTLLKTIEDNLPAGFESCIIYNMPGWVVPYSIYPNGYHCKPKSPLPFLNLANQKGFIALYHMGLYAQEELHDWFVSEYSKHCKYKLDMGKSCVRFKRMDDIPFDLIAELIQKMNVSDWIGLYEKSFLNK
ncbi:DUF1801 domain-containing protein [Vicingaceae bacterium]|nr:DUF1801 domain-containing protein [Vicingaceae bacterium]MDB4061398.1 DUF1801 domain-containing protein [Vicingaceae bacterium]MDC1451439.1 DUF1801 domain-containing protein [Vicingaceae bacterium]